MNYGPDLPHESPRRVVQRPLRAADNGAATPAGHSTRLSAVVIARQLDELVRALNYATLSGHAGLESAAEAYEVLSSLQAAMTKLPQACAQLADFLSRADATRALRAGRGFPYAGHPAVAVEAAIFTLGQAALAAGATGAALGQAHQAISGLSQAETHPRSGQRTTPSRRHATDVGAADRGRGIEL
ncbi:hypothetical protein [Sporichthya polymorpha]|uniref:hypothetical protein n=1 Tax=Sporichthya polymorpha TaxID=35751 RepID=UPI00037694F8|nr:hypothetical protein [Sporichthya polymorpha]